MVVVRSLFVLFVVCVALVLVGELSQRNSMLDQHSGARAAEAAPSQSAPEAVEDDMHKFMEYVFQPTYKRLRANLASEPNGRRAWKGIKSDSLILAECTNLLLNRLPEENSDDWIRHSILSRDYGGRLYRAARKKDYAAARKSYESMLTNCNSCHKQFAKGKHQLKP